MINKAKKWINKAKKWIQSIVTFKYIEEKRDRYPGSYYHTYYIVLFGYGLPIVSYPSNRY